ncbi:MAG: M48 family metallopeptidase [Burkholderiaceae bacterium]|jgi:predicted metal-dependent hydrolase
MMGFEQLALGFFDEPAPVPTSLRPPPLAQAAEPERPPAQQPSAAPARPTAAPAAQPDVLHHPQANRHIGLLGQHVRYAFRRGKRRTIGFVVGPEGLSVSAPRWVGVQEVEAALHEKAAWILRKLQEQRERNRRLDAARIVWAEGAEVPYLGRTVRVQLDASRVAAPGGALLDVPEDTQAGADSILWLGLPPQAQPERIRDAVHSWWQRQARRLFEQRCALYAPQLGVRVHRLSLSSAQTRWGSATADGFVRLNWRLIQFPLSTIDYVVVHELAHLREMNHSAAFWEVVRSVLPAYEQAQAPLKAAAPLTD